jgi:hypothetical protein
MSDSAPLIVEGGADQRAPSLRQADYDADGAELKKITSRCKHYLVFSILRWFAIATVAIALGIHMRGTITDWYRGEQAAAHCQTCVLHAQVAPDTLFEFAQCQTLPAFANARDKTPNLLIAGGSDFRGTPGSDVEYQNAFIIIAYCFALIILGAYMVVVIMCGAGKQANDAQNALDEFSRMGLTINVHAVRSIVFFRS